MQPRHRRRLMEAALAVLLVGMVGATALLLTRGTESTIARPAAPVEVSVAPEPKAPPLAAARAEQLRSSLASGDEARLRDALVLPQGQPLDPGLATGLAELQLRLDVASFRATGPDSAEVFATTAGDRRWTVVLLHAGGEWRIAATEQAA